jgi:hypothetical protein
VIRDRSRDIDRNQEVRLESGYMIGVISSDWSRAYDWSRVLRPELGIQLELCLPIEVGHTTGVASSDQSRDIPVL